MIHERENDKVLYRLIWWRKKRMWRCFSHLELNLIGNILIIMGRCFSLCTGFWNLWGCHRKNNSSKVKFASLNFELKIITELMIHKTEDNWTNYPKGVIENVPGEGS